jgi:hypothetical protein
VIDKEVTATGTFPLCRSVDWYSNMDIKSTPACLPGQQVIAAHNRWIQSTVQQVQAF